MLRQHPKHPLTDYDVMFFLNIVALGIMTKPLAIQHMMLQTTRVMLLLLLQLSMLQ